MIENNINWYFSNESSSGSDLTDDFSDSKFTGDKWVSFAREIIQNSIDAVDDENKPVEVTFDLNKHLTIDDIPGCKYTKYVLEKCYENATNPTTKRNYKKGLEILNKKYIYCLKISDKNTKGVTTGRDGAWGALLFDTGKSVKFRSDSGGSHGVGKKVPFIISCCNTVFYATKNKYEINGIEKSDNLMQGKTQLITWKDDEGNRKDNKGWYGKIVDENDIENRIVPLSLSESKDVNEYFIRKSEYGTDVIIVGANFYDENEEKAKRKLITSIVSNFYVGILSNKLIADVFGEKIDSSNFDKICDKWVDKKDKDIDLLDFIETFRDGVKQTEIIKDNKDKEIGSINVYFKPDNSANKKNYWIFRSQGMKIESSRINIAEQPFTCLVHICGKELNDSLLRLENAAHDKFVVEDENMDIDEYDVDNLDKINEYVRKYILAETKIKDLESQDIEGLNEIISLSGFSYNIEKKKNKAVIKRNPAIKKDKTERNTREKKKKVEGVEGIKKPSKNPKKIKIKKVGNGKYGYVYEDYQIEPVFLKNKKDDTYYLTFSLNSDIDDCMMTIRSINSDGKADTSISEMIDKINIDDKQYKYNGYIKGLKFEKYKKYVISFKTARDITYQVSVRIMCNNKGVK